MEAEIGSNPQYDNQLQGIISKLEEAEPSRIRINKQRKQIKGRFDNDQNQWGFLGANEGKRLKEDTQQILIEQTIIEMVSGGQQKGKKFTTFCVEGMDPKLITAFLEEFEIRHDKGRIMSYPEFVIVETK